MSYCYSCPFCSRSFQSTIASAFLIQMYRVKDHSTLIRRVIRVCLHKKLRSVHREIIRPIILLLENNRNVHVFCNSKDPLFPPCLIHYCDCIITCNVRAKYISFGEWRKRFHRIICTEIAKMQVVPCHKKYTQCYSTHPIGPMISHNKQSCQCKYYNIVAVLIGKYTTYKLHLYLPIAL